MAKFMAYSMRPLTSDGKKTTFSVDSKGNVFDDVRGTVKRVGTIDENGDITVIPKYGVKHGDRLLQLKSKKEK